MRVLFFNPEQYVSFDNEPSNHQLRLPMLRCGAVSDHRDHVYQRDLRSDGRNAMNRRAGEVIREYAPDVIVYSATWEHENLSPWVLRTARDRGIPVVSVLWDSWLEPTTAEAELLESSSVLVTADSLRTYLRCRLAGEVLSPVVKVMFAAGHQIFRDSMRPLPGEPKAFDVTLLGSNEGERARLTARLAEELPRHGIRFNKAGGLVDSSQGGLRLTDNWVSWEDYVRTINRSRLGLCSPTDPTRIQIKGKIFDYLACGVPCLTDDNAEVRRFFPDGTVALFRDTEDCVAQINRLFANPEALERLAAAGCRWFTETFDPDRFWASVLQAAVEGTEAPTMPLLEEAFERARSRRTILLRRELALANRLAVLEDGEGTVARLGVERMERRGRFHRMRLESGDLIATDHMPLDFFTVDGQLHAAGSGAAFPVSPGHVVPYAGLNLFCAEREEVLDTLIAAFESSSGSEVSR